MAPGVSHPFYLAAVFPVSKINIWAWAVPEGLIFYSSTLLYIHKVTDTESLLLSWLATGAAGSAIFETIVSVGVVEVQCMTF